MDENLAPVVNSGTPISGLAEILEGSCAISVIDQTDRSLDFLIGADLPGRATISADSQTMLVDLYVYNAVLLTGPARNGLVRSVLLLNNCALRGKIFTIALDDRDFLLLFGRKSVASLSPEATKEWLQYLTDQAFQIRELVSQVAWEELEQGIEYGFQTEVEAAA